MVARRLTTNKQGARHRYERTFHDHGGISEQQAECMSKLLIQPVSFVTFTSHILPPAAPTSVTFTSWL